MSHEAPTKEGIEALRALVEHYRKRVRRNRRCHLTEVRVPLDEFEMLLALASAALLQVPK